MVCGVDAAAGEDVHVGQKAVAPRAPTHQHLGVAVVLPDQHEARGVPGSNRHGDGMVA